MSPDGSGKSIPPEEKLLRLIRGGGKGAAAGSGAPERPVAGASSSAPIPGAVRRMPRRSGGGWRKGWKLPAWWVTAGNATLGLLVVLEAGVLTWLMTQPEPAPVREQLAFMPVIEDVGREPSPADAPEASVPSIAASATRILFRAAPAQPDTTGSTERAQPSQQASAWATRLTVIGIIAGELPQAIVEDAQTKKSYFVSEGQPLIEGLVVEEIRADGVVLDLQGEKIRLSL